MSTDQTNRRRVVQSDSVSHADEAPHVRLLGVARDMFCRDGIHATGIDRILAEAGVSKMTLYTRFGSKEALVREVLVQEGAEWRAHFFAAVTAGAEDARGRLACIMTALAPWFGGDRFYGCAFMNAVAEHAKGERWLRELAAEHHKEIIGFLAQLASEAGYAEPVVLARQILLVIDGAIAAFLVSGDKAVLDLTQRNLEAVLAGAPIA
jgi:AcrR family transcriptional regulator